MGIEAFLGMAALLFLLAAVLLYWKLRLLKKSLEEIAFGKRSLSARYGRMSEQFFPFMKGYPHDPQGFRFLGTPVDGVQFGKDRVVFVEFKSGDSRLSAKQKEIQEIVRKGKVGFEVVSIR